LTEEEVEFLNLSDDEIERLATEDAAEE